MPYRYDKAVTFSGVEKTEQGYLRIPASISRADCVLTYRRSDGTIIKEFRPRNEIFDEVSINSARNLPVISDRHVTRVDSFNTSKLSVGFSSENIEQNLDTLDTTILITDNKTIKRIEKGELKALSPGYRLDKIDRTPGIYNGERYDQIQRGIKYNHLALLSPGKGRQGDRVGLRLDSEDAVYCNENESEERMKVKVRFDGKDYEIEVSNETEVQILRDFAERYDAKDKDLERAKGNLDETKKQLNQEKERADKAESLDTINEIVSKRVGAIEKLKRFDSKIDDKDLQEKSLRELHVDTLVASGRVREDFNDVTDEYIQGAFDGLNIEKKLKIKKGIGGTIPKDKKERQDQKDKMSPRQAMNKNYSESWKGVK